MDLYELLGLPKGATLVEIKRSYRRLARKYHPDINPGDNTAEARFKEITRAYETLSDPDSRVRYDAAGAIGESTTITFGFEGFDFSSSGHSAASTFGDLFAEVFTQRQEPRQRAGPERGADLHTSVSLKFDEAMLGSQRQLTLTRRETCRGCRGMGVLKVAESRCRSCQGSGNIRTRRGSMVFAKTCEACGGTGIQTQTPCHACGGAGRTLAPR